MTVRLSALRAGHPLPLGRLLVLISVKGWVDTRAIVRLEGLGQLKNTMTSSGIERETFRLCSIVSQPTTLPRAPVTTGNYNNLTDMHTLQIPAPNIKTSVSSPGIFRMLLLSLDGGWLATDLVPNCLILAHGRLDCCWPSPAQSFVASVSSRSMTKIFILS
jgi:hypothetical protein